MKIVLFYHSLLSDWNHENAHFLRGFSRELLQKGHQVKIYEAENNWSLSNLIREQGKSVLREFTSYFPGLSGNFYNPDKPEFSKILTDADVVIVHERNDHLLVNKIGQLKKKFGYRLFFHDTHHRSVSDGDSMAKYDLSCYDGVLVSGNAIRETYLKEGLASDVWTWHEAADVTLFRPIDSDKEGDLVWVGNWGDDQRIEDIHEYLIKPAKELRLKARVYGARYPKQAIKALEEAGIQYGGWVPNFKLPELFSKYRFTVHIPERTHSGDLPTIPAIRPFEALACGIPLLSSPWADSDNLFTPGREFLIAKDSYEMKHYMLEMLNSTLSEVISMHGLKAINNKHTCLHRTIQLETILMESGTSTERISNQEEQIAE